MSFLFLRDASYDTGFLPHPHWFLNPTNTVYHDCDREESNGVHDLAHRRFRIVFVCTTAKLSKPHLH